MKLFILAGELSGDKLGASLIAALKSLVPNCEIQGVAGPMMQAEGIESLFPMTELSVMGISEVLPKYLHLKRRLNETAQAVLAFQPDALITIDSPDFRCGSQSSSRRRVISKRSTTSRRPFGLGGLGGLPRWRRMLITYWLYYRLNRLT